MFFKNAIAKMKEQHKLTILVRPRGDLVEFATRELDVPIRVVSKHYPTHLGKFWGLILRVGYLILERFRNPYDVITSHGGLDAAIAGRLSLKKSVIFYDTYEYRSLFELCRLFSSKYVVPESLGVKGKNVVTYNGYKELAHLYDFEPSTRILNDLKVKKKSYVFIRHIAHVSLDCWEHNHESTLERIVEYLNSRNYPIVASVEQGADHIPLLMRSAKVLQKSTSEMHSLMYHASCVVSSGGTVAREAAVLGVPAMYIGRLDMRVQRDLIREGLLKWPSEAAAVQVIEELLNNGKTVNPISEHRWENMTDIIIQNLEN